MPPFDDASLKRIAETQQSQPSIYAQREQAAKHKTGMSKWAIAALEAGQGLDVATTAAMLPSDRFREGNPIGLKAIVPIKAALMVALPWLAKETKMPRNVANALGVIVGAAGAIPGAMNLRTYAKTPK